MAQYRGPQVSRETTLEQLLELFAMLVKDLQFILNGHLNANNIQANSIETKNLKAGIITTDKLAAGSVTADKITVDELSAITANLGHITAGLIEAITIIGSVITGSLIQTSASSYPRAEMRSSDQMFLAASDPDNTIKVIASSAGVPSIVMSDGTLDRGSLSFSNDLTGTKKTQLRGTNGMVLNTTGGDLDVITGLYKATFGDWNSIYARSVGSTGQTLQQALNAKANTFNGWTGSFSTGSQTVNVSNGIITSVV